MKKVIIYSTPTCPYCVMAKEFFTQNKIEFVDVDVTQDHEKAHEMMEKSGQMGVPVIDIEGKIIVGFDKEAVKKELGI
ncbi:NrdH-redoxin [Candidatus Woesearchaeota archaeon]|nr:NrdH-redoxin [Candidatus Woesearchaeota archaeon]